MNNQNNTITKTDVRRDFSYIRSLMRTADEMMKQKNIDCSFGSDFEQLSLELSAAAITLSTYVEQQRLNGEAQ